jgi:hypothetical protein
MPAAPDIIVPLTADPNGPQAWVWVDFIGIDRGGQTPMPGNESLTDKWRINLVARASLAQGGQLVLKPDGSEISIDLPPGYSSPSIDIAKLLHDQAVLAALPLVRDVAVRLIAGSLVPQGQP